METGVKTFKKSLDKDWKLLGKQQSKPNDPLIGDPKMKGRRWTISLEYKDFYPNIIKESLVKEDPDSAYVPSEEFGGQEELNFEDSHVTSVFSIFDNEQKDRLENIISLCRDGSLISVTTGDDQYDREIFGLLHNIEMVQAVTHTTALIKLIHAGILRQKSGELLRSRKNALINGRSWNFNGIDYVSFWNGPRECKTYKSNIDDIFDVVGIKKESVQLEFIGYNGEWMSYDDAFGGSNQNKPKLSPEQIKSLMKKQHLDPKAKQLLLKLSGATPDKLQKAADSAKMSVAQLKSLINRGD